MCIRDSDALTFERRGGRPVQLVAIAEGLRHTLAELGVVGAGEHAVGKPYGVIHDLTVRAAQMPAYEWSPAKTRLTPMKFHQNIANPRIARRAARLPCLLYTSPSPRDRTRSRMPS